MRDLILSLELVFVLVLFFNVIYAIVQIGLGRSGFDYVSKYNLGKASILFSVLIVAAFLFQRNNVLYAAIANLAVHLIWGIINLATRKNS